MPIMLELQKTVERLDDNSKVLLLEIAKKFVINNNWEDELSLEDLHLIKLAEKEYINGETTGHNDIDWN
jgi:hypothetical protein